MQLLDPLYTITALVGAVAFFGFFVARRLTRSIDIDKHQNFLDAMLSIVGTLVSILLGLLVASALDNYRNLEHTVDTEAANVAQVFRLSGGLPLVAGLEIRQLCGVYSEQIVNDEWPAMERGGHSDKVIGIYATLVQRIVTFAPATEGESNLHAALLSAVQTIADCRRERILALDNPWKQHLTPVLFMCSLIVLAFAFLYGRQGGVLHGVMICLVAIALAANLSLILLLSNPFSGEWKIKPKAFELNIRMLQELRSSPQLQKLFKPEN